jgi:CBS domain-containing protein/gamma-glutamyl:cysteine ligase YbdK (ATP-grasp superfamily)
MGTQDIRDKTDNEGMRTFVRALLEDVRALEAMINQEGLFESDVRRIGAEQEMFLVDRALRPANRALAALEHLPRASFTTELGQFNLEANLSPHVLGGSCLSDLEKELRGMLDQASAAAEKCGARVVLTGILPTLEKRDLGMESMTPIPRYYQLNHVMRELRGGEFRTLIKGLDQLETTHDNVMLEACNTSFQIHFQVAPREFAKLYNVAQVVTAPVLAAAVNSPVLLRHRLWHETRVALFQQSVDTRSEVHASRGGRQRVSFGDDWIDDSVLEIFRDDIARFRVLIATELDESPLALLEQGKIPELKALRLHNGTIYRWNRPCYGVSGGRPHLRIENRVLPAGPTVIDEMANAAFYFGLMCAVADEYGDVREAIPFSDAQENFLAAARYGLQARLKWFGGKSVGADELVHELIPIARQGLVDHDLDSDEVDRYLGVLDERVARGRTGAQWMLDSLDGMHASRPDERYRALTAAICAQQQAGKPVHEWELARVQGTEDIRDSYRTVGQIMTTDLFTVHPEDLIDLAASVMDWEHLRHVPVEDQEGKLVGLVTYRSLLRTVGQGAERARMVAVREIMRTDPVAIGPETPTIEAIELMRRERCGCLPVVEEDRLVGIVTESDFIHVSAMLLEEWLRKD